MDQTVVLIPSVNWSVHLIENPEHPTRLSSSKGVILQPRKMGKDTPLRDPYLDVSKSDFINGLLSLEELNLFSACVARIKSQGPVSSLVFKLEV